MGQLIDLPPGTEHSLPWYPPLCNVANSNTEDSDIDVYFPVTLVRDGLLDVPGKEASLKPHLTKYVSEGRNMAEEEIGQRILTAINKVCNFSLFEYIDKVNKLDEVYNSWNV